ncbi:3-oxoadipyl-CoA thiolase [Paracoccus sp. SM22M-07]|uniref:3-oxoadipyl-CoA thiolase n=1 Tax=Paracoccus sp. SM22M-07 TaxID=1520813 RepID=UPI00091187F5|nr:3-oxoadipyl-CoA thiolase [Paracoccus sp. SM22M-07]OJH43312.1 beta-ketoadipyl CoA thiolase [Paracoccus sp. SM22M-07]
MTDVFICDYIRTPIGRYGGALSAVRPDDLGAVPLRALLERNPDLDPAAIDEVIFGCANQAGEDNRNVARMSSLLAGLPETVPGTTINRLCGSGMDAVITAFRAIAAGEADLIVAGGVESMSRAPLVMPKAETAFSRAAEIHDTTIGWRFVNPQMHKTYGTDSMPQTGQNVADDFGVSREAQDTMALSSQQKAAAAQEDGRLAREITPVLVPQRKGDPVRVDRDEHPRKTSAEALAKLRPLFPEGSVTAGNASGVNDGAAALILATADAARQHGLRPIAKVLGGATAGVAPRIMGFGPAPASKKLMKRLGLTIDDFAVIELNEAFAAQGIATLRDLGVADDDARVNPNGGAIALGHPLGMSGARITGTAALELKPGEKALATMCIGVGQGIAIALEGVQA